MEELLSMASREYVTACLGTRVSGHTMQKTRRMLHRIRGAEVAKLHSAAMTWIMVASAPPRHFPVHRALDLDSCRRGEAVLRVTVMQQVVAGQRQLPALA